MSQAIRAPIQLPIGEFGVSLDQSYIVRVFSYYVFKQRDYAASAWIIRGSSAPGSQLLRQKLPVHCGGELNSSIRAGNNRGHLGVQSKRISFSPKSRSAVMPRV